MHPIHDVDVLVLLATMLASKRRPGELAEIVAAADLIQAANSLESKLAEAFHRLSVHGLVAALEGGFTLTAAGQEIMTGHPKKADTAERLILMKEKLSAYQPKGEHAAIELSAEQVAAAILAHKTSAQGAGRNLLMPKPKTAETDRKRPGQWRKFSESRRRRD